MIIGTIRHWQRCRSQYGNAVCRALESLAALNTDDMPSTLQLDGKLMFVMKQSPATGTFEEKPAEVHAQHADIHLVLEGEEWQGYAAASDGSPPVEDKLEENDYALFGHVGNEARIKLRPGDFTVFWPGEIHRPNCHPEGSVHLVKLVVKIHRDLF